jgi:hypothetical protein
LSSIVMPLGAIRVFSSTSISSMTSTLIGASPARRSMRVALTRTSSSFMAISSITKATLTVTTLSRSTRTVIRFGW